MTVLGELKAHYPEILNMMPDEFDSHHFILMLAHKHQPEYVHEDYSDDIFRVRQSNAVWRKRK
jgi:hypothetical protein